MSETYLRILSLLDFRKIPAICHDDARRWSAGSLEQAAAGGLLTEAPRGTGAICDSCGEYRDAVLVGNKVAGSVEGRLQCPDCGLSPISISRLRRWQVNLEGLLELALAGSGIERCLLTIVPNQVYSLGKADWDGRRDVYFVRGSPKVSPNFRIAHSAAVLVPINRPLAHLSPVMYVPLSHATSWNGEEIVWDMDYVQSQVIAHEGAVKKPLQPRPRRKNRMALIGALEKQLREHLRSAKSYALDTRLKTGDPQLLPRPTMDFLAAQLGVNKSTVSRCLEDPAARGLAVLWDAADDVERILSLSGR